VRQYQATIYETALGSMRLSEGEYGPRVFIVGPQECTHHLTAAQARDAASALLKVATEVEETEAARPMAADDMRRRL
jgi:hypothetical protein